jgi:hypothetical protein
MYDDDNDDFSSDDECEDEDTSPDYVPSEEEWENDEVRQEKNPDPHHDSKYIVSSSVEFITIVAFNNFRCSKPSSSNY